MDFFNETNHSSTNFLQLFYQSIHDFIQAGEEDILTITGKTLSISLFKRTGKQNR